ncbi:hypothetical protein [Corallococcus macrosporus]|uniref:hypothetical protein n=1 Tax=Corallococcus macrosporus TaxID=35 RepID=UPI001F5C8303|nr:hypothetical protein [Corallococcus macrosporus]
MARATFVDEPASMEAAPDLPLLGPLPTTGLPQVGGYNLTYLKPRANVALRTLDTNAAPVLALWPHGAGRTVALTAEVDGKYTASCASGARCGRRWRRWCAGRWGGPRRRRRRWCARSARATCCE